MNRFYAVFLVLVMTACIMLMLHRELGIAILALVGIVEIIDYRKKSWTC